MTHSVDTVAQLRGLLCGTRQLVGEERKMLLSEKKRIATDSRWRRGTEERMRKMKKEKKKGEKKACKTARAESRTNLGSEIGNNLRRYVVTWRESGLAPSRHAPTVAQGLVCALVRAHVWQLRRAPV